METLTGQVLAGNCDDIDLDCQMRRAAFEQVRRIAGHQGCMTWAEIDSGFSFGGQEFHLCGRARGIFKPRAMKFLLSIKTVVPREGRKIWYDDQTEAHHQIFTAEESVEYSFMGTDPNAHDNQLLRAAYSHQIPIIYFLGIAPRKYVPLIPCYVSDWDGKALKARIDIGLPGTVKLALPSEVPERRYALTHAKQRVHQACFREAVIEAYGGRCALSGLRELRLLDAAHIVPDADEGFGQPVVVNGIPLTKIHHAAFDANLIGIDPDYGVHVSGRLLEQQDGPMLEALKQLQGKQLILPSRDRDRPDRNRLAFRFDQFKLAA